MPLPSTSRLMQEARLLLSDPSTFLRHVARTLRPMPAEYRRRYRMTLRKWLIHHHTSIVFQDCTWMGKRALKNPMDAWIYQEMLYEVRPDVVIEIGSNEGGSTLFLAHVLDLLGAGQVVSVDISRTKWSVEHPRIATVTGDSSSPEVVAQVAAFCKGKSALVIQDGDHTYEGVAKDMRAYAPFVGVGSYFIVEDGIIDLFTPGDGLGGLEAGPLAASDEFLREHPEFVVDPSRERYLLTYNPRGFLKRVR